jgi:hypothetical protein
VRRLTPENCADNMMALRGRATKWLTQSGAGN